CRTKVVRPRTLGYHRGWGRPRAGDVRSRRNDVMCYDSNARPPIPPGDGGTAQSRELVLAAADGNRFAAFLATPDAPKGGGVIIYPDVRGLHQFYKDLAVRFAEQGVAALAIDYFGRTAGLTPRDDAFEYMPHVQQMRFETFQRDVDAAREHLRSAGDRPES